MNTTIERTTRSEQETMQLAASLAKHLRGGELITLDGPLGAGKTCFVRGLAQGLGIAPSDVSSPTFVLVHEYRANGSPRLVHVDAYRLHDASELDTIGWEEYLRDAESIIVVEWASRIAQALADRPRIAISFEHVSEQERAMTFTVSEAFARVLEPLRDQAQETI